MIILGYYTVHVQDRVKVLSYKIRIHAVLLYCVQVILPVFDMLSLPLKFIKHVTNIVLQCYYVIAISPGQFSKGYYLPVTLSKYELLSIVQTKSRVP